MKNTIFAKSVLLSLMASPVFACHADSSDKDFKWEKLAISIPGMAAKDKPKQNAVYFQMEIPSKPEKSTSKPGGPKYITYQGAPLASGVASSLVYTLRYYPDTLLTKGTPKDFTDNLAAGWRSDKTSKYSEIKEFKVPLKGMQSLFIVADSIDMDGTNLTNISGAMIIGKHLFFLDLHYTPSEKVDYEAAIKMLNSIKASTPAR